MTLLVGWLFRRFAWGIVSTLVVWFLWITLLWPILSALDWVVETFGVAAGFVVLAVLLLMWAFIQLTLTIIFWWVVARTLKGAWDDRRS